MHARTLSPAEAAAMPSVGPDDVAAPPSRISWGAVLAGALLALAITTTLNVLGAAIGMGSIDLTERDGPSAATFGIAGGVWVLVAHLLALAVGGWVAARLSGTIDRGDGALHGLAVWAFAFLISAMVLGNVVSGIASSATSGLASIVGGAARGAGEAASAVAGQVDVEAQVDRVTTALRTGGDPAAMTPEQRSAEIGSLITQRVTTGTLDDTQRQRLVALVAAEAGVSPEEAARRVQEVEQEAQRRAAAVEERARQAADATASAAATASFWLFAAMVLGAVAGLLGGRAGVRDAVYHRAPRTTAGVVR
jgi:hypothetical protein